MVAGLAKSLAKQVEKGKRTEAEAAEISGRVRATTHLGELVDVDLVIESVVEDLSVKKDLFAELDSICKPETILATNTSTLPVVEMAMATGRPDLVCGIHFFNPAPAMALVEVVRPITASDATVAAAVSFADSCGKDPVEVKDQAGFIVNALLFPYLNNAVRLLEQGDGHQGGDRRRHEGRLRLPDGPLRTARPRRASTRRWPSSTRSTTSTATPTTPPCRCCAASSPRGSSAARPRRASTTTAASRRGRPRPGRAEWWCIPPSGGEWNGYRPAA